MMKRVDVRNMLLWSKSELIVAQRAKLTAPLRPPYHYKHIEHKSLTLYRSPRQMPTRMYNCARQKYHNKLFLVVDVVKWVGFVDEISECKNHCRRQQKQQNESKASSTQ